MQSNNVDSLVQRPNNTLDKLKPIPENPKEDLRRRRLRYTIVRDLCAAVSSAHKENKTLPLSLEQIILINPEADPERNFYSQSINNLISVIVFDNQPVQFDTGLLKIMLGYFTNESLVIPIARYSFNQFIEILPDEKIRNDYYRAPEQLEKPLNTRQSDLYKLAIVIFEIITCASFGKLQTEQQKEVMTNYPLDNNPTILPDLQKALSLYFLDCPADLQDAIWMSWCSNPDSRNNIDIVVQAAQQALDVMYTDLPFDTKPDVAKVEHKETTYEDYKTLSGKLDGQPVDIKEYSKKEVYLHARDINCFFRKRPELNPYCTPLLGFNDEKQQIIERHMAGSISSLFTNERSEKLLTDIARAWILYDAARALQILHQNFPGETTQDDAMIKHHGMESHSLFLEMGWEKQLKEHKDWSDLSALPVLAKLATPLVEDRFDYESGKSIWIPFSFNNSLLKDEHTKPSDIWRWGLLAFEVYCSITLRQATEEDRCRIIRHNLKPQHSSSVSEAYTRVWMNTRTWQDEKKTGLKPPDLIFEIVRGCWHADPAKRPTADILVKVAKWNLEDILISHGKLPSRKDFQINRGEYYTDKVLEKVGYSFPLDSPPMPKNDGVCACRSRW